MDAVLLAGGFGTRLRPLTYTRPKPLLAVAGKPMVEWALDRLPPSVDRVIVAVNWKAQDLRDHFARSERDVEFVVEQEATPLGTAGAVKNCERHIESDAFFVLNADIISDMDLAALAGLREAEDAPGAISLKEVPQAELVNFGVVKPAKGPGCAEVPEAVRISGFVEKPKDPTKAPSRLANAGAYCLSRDILDLIPEDKLVSMEKEVFPQLIPDGFWGLPFEGRWIDVGDPLRLLLASKSLDPNFQAGPGSLIEGRLSGSVAGKGCRIGRAALIERSILGDKVVVDPGVRLTDCVVGDGETVMTSAASQRIWTKPIPHGYPAQQVGNAI